MKRKISPEERWDDEVEENLKRILANPTLAEETFPDPRVRGNILSFFQNMRRLAKGGQPKG